MEATTRQSGALIDTANPVVTHSSPVVCAASSPVEFEDPFAPFASVLSTLNFQSVALIPEIHDYCETPSNEIGVPYVLMDFAEGFPVSEKWFDDTGPTPKLERQLRILDTTAAAMSQLRKFKFDKIGSLHYEPGSTNPTDIRQCIVVDELASIDTATSGIDYLQIGPFDASREYFEVLLCTRKTPSDPFAVGILCLLRMMFEYIPRSVRTPEEDRESFVLSHPDFDSQNVLVSEDGTLTALLDWDNVQTLPRCIGHSRYPAWITRDWDPAVYCYGDSAQLSENSPEELEFFRRHYAEKMGPSISDALDFATKSHLFEALWIAASNPLCTDGIVEKIFNYLFPEDGQDDDLEEPIYLPIFTRLPLTWLKATWRKRRSRGFGGHLKSCLTCR